MTQQQENAQGPARALFAEAAAREFETATERLEWLYRTRIDQRKDPSALEWLNRLIKGGARGLGHIDNAMHVAITDGSLSDGEFARFLAAYYWGSNYGFNKTVLPGTLKSTGNDWYREYIKNIIREENTPSSHWGIFKRYMQDLGFELGEPPESAQDFVRKNTAGYQAELGHAIGYALAVEVESDFQLSLIALALMKRFPRATAETIFFDIHLDSSGEEEHARMTCGAVAQLLDAGQIHREDVEAGFVGAIVDTRDFMLAMHEEVTNTQPVAQVW
jgi:hypothetical protein